MSFSNTYHSKESDVIPKKGKVVLSAENFDNEDAVIELFKNHHYQNFEHVSQRLKSSKSFFHRLMKENILGLLLIFASDEIKDDKEIVLKCVEKYSYSVKFASVRLRNDEDVMLMAIKPIGAGQYLEYGSDKIKDNKKVFLAAIKTSYKAYNLGSKRLREDMECVHALYKNAIFNYFCLIKQNSVELTVQQKFEEFLKTHKEDETALVAHFTVMDNNFTVTPVSFEVYYERPMQHVLSLLSKNTLEKLVSKNSEVNELIFRAKLNLMKTKEPIKKKDRILKI